ncbi:unnamed protein product [Linum tenue]|uniref:DNA N(6)-methyladenine demethylase n=1 Tax=Linum tenue TaxID=586396 RepID=A0AAV0KA65_9ROSI|nr:unnamed protein product [Linum tenue]
MNPHGTPTAGQRGRRGGRGRSAAVGGRSSWAPVLNSPPTHYKVGGEENYADDSSRRMSGLSLGRGSSSHQNSPGTFSRDSYQASEPAAYGMLQTMNPFELGNSDDGGSQKGETAAKASGSESEQAEVGPVNRTSFDICPLKTGGPVRLKPSLSEVNKLKRNMQRNMEGNNGRVLRPGMVLLKHHLSLDDQVKIVNLCRKLGVGTGGFYQPEYRNGEKMHLKMMCLGRNWEPDDDKYVENRNVDGAKPHSIPQEFSLLVRDAIKDSQALIEETCKPGNVEYVLPSMSPSICVVNFYTASGRLGLHQDKAESFESLRKGLPVVSFSIGDSAEFEYADQRDDKKAEKVLLESGDVLIFGGISRNIFHGVTKVQQNTAPKALLDQTNLRTGRLNLTFRQY